MHSRFNLALKGLALILTCLAGMAVLYAGAKVLPLFLANSRFQRDLDVRTRVMSLRYSSIDQVRDAVLSDAQSDGVPIQPENIHVESAPSGIQITADYQANADLHFCQAGMHFHLQSPEDKRALSPNQVRFLTALGMLFGAQWLFRGFLIFRKYRVLADTPLVPIRSVAMGLVEIHGTAVGERTMVSPVSNVPCFLYSVNFERWVGNSRGSGRWTPQLTDSAWVSFRLRDETGDVRIDPRGAEFDLEPTGQREISRRPGLLPGHAWETEEQPASGPGLPLSDSELRRYVIRATAGMHTADFQVDDPGFKDNVNWEQKKPRLRIVRSLANPVEFISSIAPGFLSGGFNHTAGEIRLTEYCIVPETSYDITGTCQLDTSNGPESERQVIKKGLNAPTFLISNRNEKDIEGSLRARARLYIFGGGLLAIGCAAGLLEALGLIR